MREEHLNIDAGEHSLAGSLAYATSEKPKAVVIMFAGSGPVDRNENLPSFSLNVLNALAEAFAERRYASVRYDKRGCGASSGDYISAGHNDFVDDALLVTRTIAMREEFQDVPVVLLGHSEGAAIAPQVAAQMNSAGTFKVAGQILLCPFSRPMREVLIQQATNRNAEVSAMTGIKGMIARSFVRLRGGFVGMQTRFLKRIEKSKTDTVTMAKVTLNAKWYREMLALDIKEIFNNVRTPTFAIGGGKDAQCDPLDTVALHQLITHAPITTHVEENLTHILRCDDQPQAMGRYPELVKRPIEGLVGERCCGWLDGILANCPAASHNTHPRPPDSRDV